MGMSLSEILDRLVQIENINTKPFDDVLDLLEQARKSYNDVKFINKAEANQAAKEVKQAILAYRAEISDLKALMERNIYENHEQFIAESERFYQENINKMTFEEHRDWSGRWIISDDDLSNLASWVSTHCHWQQPALMVGAGDSSIIDSVVSADPVYVLERYQEYFYLQKAKFSDAQARKMRFYTNDEMTMLPRNSFSMIAIYNQFNFLPWKQTSELIKELEKCLAPGGSMVFSYNNCKTVKGFQFFEKRVAAYSIPSMYISLADEIGLSLSHMHESNNGQFSFMQLTKPGSLKLVKKFPSLGIVKQQDNLGNKVIQDIRNKKLIHIFKS